MIQCIERSRFAGGFNRRPIDEGPVRDIAQEAVFAVAGGEGGDGALNDGEELLHELPVAGMLVIVEE